MEVMDDRERMGAKREKATVEIVKARNNKGLNIKDAWGRMELICMLLRRLTWENLVAD